jgi:hypothetical protein
MYPTLKIGILTIIMVFLSACTMNNSISLPEQFWQQKHKKIIVARLPAVVPKLHKQGQEGLVDIVINDVVTSNFNKQINTYSMGWYRSLQASFYKKLQQRRMNARLLSEALDNKNFNYTNQDITRFSERDYRALAVDLHADQLLLIRVNSVGALRQYYGFVPLTEPVAYCDVQGDLIDLTTNQVIWRGHGTVSVPMAAEWNQPPNYPIFMQALDEAVAKASSQLMSSFFQR